MHAQRRSGGCYTEGVVMAATSEGHSTRSRVCTHFAPRFVPQVSGSRPSDCSLSLLRSPDALSWSLAQQGVTLGCRYEKWYGERGSIHFASCALARDAFMDEHIYPHISEREAAGEFHAFAEELDTYVLRAFEVEQSSHSPLEARDTEVQFGSE